MVRRVWSSYGFVLIVLLAVLLATTACQPVQRVSAKAETPQQANQAVIERFYEEVVNQKHVEVMQEVFAAKMVAHEYSQVKPTVTEKDLFAAMPDLNLKVDKWVIDGDLLTALVTISGTHTGEDLAGVAAKGEPVTWTQIDIWRVEDGKIAEVWHNFALADIYQQLGYTLVPPAK